MAVFETLGFVGAYLPLRRQIPAAAITAIALVLLSSAHLLRPGDAVGGDVFPGFSDDDVRIAGDRKDRATWESRGRRRVGITAGWILEDLRVGDFSGCGDGESDRHGSRGRSANRTEESGSQLPGQSHRL